MIRWVCVAGYAMLSSVAMQFVCPELFERHQNWTIFPTQSLVMNSFVGSTNQNNHALKKLQQRPQSTMKFHVVTLSTTSSSSSYHCKYSGRLLKLISVNLSLLVRAQAFLLQFALKPSSTVSRNFAPLGEVCWYVVFHRSASRTDVLCSERSAICTAAFPEPSSCLPLESHPL